MTKYLDEIREKVKEYLPPKVRVKSIEFEGPQLVIYVENPQELAEVDIVKKLAKDLRKRIIIRADPKSLKPPEKARQIIMQIVPEDARISNIFFDEENGEVIIEAEKPGVVIGKQGSTFREIMRAVGWSPRVVRTPPIKSKIIDNIRNYLLSVREERSEILKRIGERIHRTSLIDEKWVRVTFLGGSREVGRSCYLLQTPESRILIDCGVNVSNLSSTPYLYVPEVQPLDALDAVVITHAHLDHCGLVPLLYKFGYRGPIYLTPPTRDLMVLLQLDFLEVAGREGTNPPYSSNLIREALKHTITLDYGVVTDISPDVRLTFYNAGHILGSAIAHFHIGEGHYNIAFTGDFKFEKTRLFDRAATNFPRLEALVMEATYGGANDFQPSRKEAEERLIEVINRTLDRGGKVLIPTFAVGRSQEVMIVLEEAMREKRLRETYVYLDGMIYEATAIHTAYPEYLNAQLRDLIFYHGINPFISENFVRVDSSSKREEVISDPSPSIIIATSGMLNGGPVMEYFRHLAEDERNTIVFVGYQAEGTLGRKIQKGWKEVPFPVDGRREVVEVKMEVETVDGFSGHSDRKQLMNYIRYLNSKPEKVATVHGDESKCIDLASSIYKTYRIETRAPMNLETIRFV
ncbi:beta-CASP ribonuclease aCPSF1 [Archaeoglobus fulgidus]|uniref:Transcription termination factor FttA n=2 Tax=Archaeoglobus fulgidus TaxID=2234 RepID=A0A075WI97_ARCFL|nr:beta-CASP ribonuclease aCPSF1 [Archaeoglobus fulgidus]AIG97298.1 universal archaeal KH-domain protein/beta-lactamase-domain protein [Archaeoglobus fulgidus DSM 8774]KUJ93742.1 MAG: mRNA 3'-end processing factor, putative [Archaeoglobus fulgidus]KUK06037.1 MAG: mRNA 3'-end processing factor, putative [Archaeoglobus fulgidus]